MSNIIETSETFKRKVRGLKLDSIDENFDSISSDLNRIEEKE